jgi:HPt (histidine-containing phosphotransfer) domain-containing protein
MSKDKITVNIDPDLEDLIPGFLANRKEDIVKLKSALANEDIDNLRSIGHSLKGVGGGYGFQKITEIGAEIEDYAKEKNLQSIEELIDNLEDYLGRVEIIFQS